MEWVSVKDRLPSSGELVIIKLKYSTPFMSIARFLDNFTSLEGDYNDIFVIIVHPRFPKTWLFDEQYRKLSRIPKKKVDFWMPLAAPPKEQ